MRASMKWRFIFAVASPSPPFFFVVVVRVGDEEAAVD
jgi:hypothetical protein